MAERPQKSITQSLIEFLATKGNQGATLSEIYAAIRADIGEKILDSSIRATLYRKLKGKKNRYKPNFDRYIFKGIARYRLLE